MYLIVYDISNNRRRTQLHKKLSVLGRPVQLSVFELADQHLNAALSVIETELLPEDSIRVYHICKRCMKTVRILGSDAVSTASQQISSPVIEVPKSVPGKKGKPYTLIKGPREKGEITNSSHLLSLICAMNNLNDAFLKVRSKRGCAGSDGVSIAAFDKKRVDNLSVLQRELMSGEYRPKPLRVISISKADGTARILKVPSVRDRTAQQAVLRIIGPIWERELEDISYAYRPGRSVKQAVSKLRGYQKEGRNWVVRTDVDDYFDEIPHKEMLARFSEKISDEQLLSLVSLWIYATTALESKGAVPSMESFAENSKGIPQGSVVSPLLANIYLDHFDEQMIALGYKVVRYADDFVVACQSETEAEEAFADITRLLAEDGLRMNTDKTTLTTFSKGFPFLGYHFIGAFALKIPKLASNIRIKNIE